MAILQYYAVCILALHYVQADHTRILNSTNRTREPRRPRIIQGDYVTPGEIRYIVMTKHNNKNYNCGGGIIDDYYVLSGAHCYINNQNKFADKTLKVVAGIINFHDESDPRRVEAEVEKIFIPSSYNDSAHPNDIALLKLKTSLDIEKNNLTKLSLPSKSIGDLTNQTALMAGFGYGRQFLFCNRFYSGGRLRKADILIYDNAKCQELYEKDTIHESYLCGKMIKSSWNKYGVCNGDSGSPLVMDDKESKVVIGVASWSHGCDERKVPMVYTRVTSFLTFIKNAMKGKTQNTRTRTFK